MARNFIKILLVILSVMAAANFTYAQNKDYVPLVSPITPSSGKKDSIGQEDMGDVLHNWFHLKPGEKNDSIGLKPIITIIPAVGYSLQSRLAVLLTGNMAFRTAPQSNISTVVASIVFTQNKQITIPIQSSFWTRDNKYNFVGEVRLYHYPQSTFGLGSNSNIEDEAAMNYNYIRFQEVVLRRISGEFYLGAGYIIDYHTNISIKPSENGTIPDYNTYGPEAHTVSSGFTLNGEFDSRDNPLNAYRGLYASFELRANAMAFGSTRSWNSVILDVRRYINFPEGSKNTLALWSYNWITVSGKPPYLDLPATLWDVSTNAGRGYIQGRFRGAQMIYGEIEYRYRITPNGLLGGVVFLNGQTFSAAPGTPLEYIQPGFGPGLRVKLNKTSRTNISIDYGFGTEGSHGLFVNVGELF